MSTRAAGFSLRGPAPTLRVHPGHDGAVGTGSASHTDVLNFAKLQILFGG